MAVQWLKLLRNCLNKKNKEVNLLGRERDVASIAHLLK